MKLLLILILTVALLACGPVYQTTYSYTPPGNLPGNQCANQCQSTQQSCENSEREEYRNCQYQSQLHYNSCLASQIFVYNPKKKKTECVANCSCYEEYCSEPDYALCTNRYNTCYLNCGGIVLSTTQCVQDCEKAEPPSTQVLSGALIK